MRGICPKSPEEQAVCRQNKPYSDTHHLFFPSSIYKTAIEKAFRELPENKEQDCRCDHADIHATQEPPEKPTRDEMLEAIARSAIEGATDAA